MEPSTVGAAGASSTGGDAHALDTDWFPTAHTPADASISVRQERAHNSSTTAYTGARAIVVGGSIGGLTAALLLRDLGFTVDVYERSPSPLVGRGGGIVLQPDTVRWFTQRSGQPLSTLSTSTNYVQYFSGREGIAYREPSPHNYTSWGALYRALLTDFGTDHYHLGENADGFSQAGQGASVQFVSGHTESADLVVFADGINSTARQRFDPAAALQYSGYIGWRGTHKYELLSDNARALLADALTFDVVSNSHIALYPIPADADVRPDHHLMNYVWYRNIAESPELAELLTDKRGVPALVSIQPGRVQDRFITELREAAAELLSPPVAEVVINTETPYLQVVSDVRSARMAEGRLALIGDAACSARPHAAAGTAKAAADAWTLAAALTSTDGDIIAALARWEPAQLQMSDALQRRAIAIGEAFQVTGTATPGDPALRFGLYGPGQ